MWGLGVHLTDPDSWRERSILADAISLYEKGDTTDDLKWKIIDQQNATTYYEQVKILDVIGDWWEEIVQS